MKNIRKAKIGDLARIAEIEIFNYRLNFYPIFKNDDYYFNELQVPTIMKQYEGIINNMWVYDDGAVKGFIQIENEEIKKLFVEPVLQGNCIGSNLLMYAIENHSAKTLWALEKNTRAIRFYEGHGFRITADKKLEEDTTEYLIRLERESTNSNSSSIQKGGTMGNGKYDDMVYMQNPTPTCKPRMSLHDRAAQFSPFAALTGYDDAVEETARLTDTRLELSEDMKTVLNEKMQMILDNADSEPVVTITYFVPDKKKSGGAYVDITGIVKEIDEYERCIVMTDKRKIPIEQIREIDGELFKSLE